MNVIWVIMLGAIVIACVTAVVVALGFQRKVDDTPEGRCWQFGEDSEADCRYCDHWRECRRYDRRKPA